MNVIQYNNYWIASDQYLNQQHRDENAKLIWDYLTSLGWTPQSVAGILGNMEDWYNGQEQQTLHPQDKNLLPLLSDTIKSGMTGNFNASDLKGSMMRTYSLTTEL